MSGNLIILLMRLLVLSLFAFSFISDYKYKDRQDRVIEIKDRVIASMKKTIEYQDENIAIRKQKMGY